jgi:hypothetical protein
MFFPFNFLLFTSSVAGGYWSALPREAEDMEFKGFDLKQGIASKGDLVRRLQVGEVPGHPRSRLEGLRIAQPLFNPVRPETGAGQGKVGSQVGGLALGLSRSGIVTLQAFEIGEYFWACSG